MFTMKANRSVHLPMWMMWWKVLCGCWITFPKQMKRCRLIDPIEAVRLFAFIILAMIRWLRWDILLKLLKACWEKRRRKIICP